VNAEDALLLEQIATRISETLYYAGGHIKDAHSQSATRFIRHDDYDLLRAMAKRLRGEDGQLAHEIGRTTLPWTTP
jgi:hypothetical protein